MSVYNPRNRNYRHGQDNTAPHAWAQAFHDSRKPRERERRCGFYVPGEDR